MNEEPVRLMHYDPRWRQEFEQTRSSILHSCAGWVVDVRHIGSTAISGLIAQPTIDVIATVQSVADLDQARMLIEGLNFACETPPSWADETTVLRKPRKLSTEQPYPTHRVFLLAGETGVATRMIAVRDCLRENRELSLDFEEAKVERWRRGGGDLISYEAEKNEFFTKLHEKLGFE